MEFKIITMKNFWVKNLLYLWNFLTGTCRVSAIIGKPRHLTLFTQQYLCITRWLAALMIPIWFVTLAQHTTVGLETFFPATQYFDYDKYLMATSFATGAIVIGLVGAVRMLYLPNSPFTLEKVNKSVFWSALLMLSCESLQWGFTHGHQAHLSSFTFGCFLIFAIAPLKISQQILLATLIISILLIAAQMTQISLDKLQHMYAKVTLPLAAMIIGAGHLRWQFNNFKLNQLYDLRLKRRNREVQRQKIELENNHIKLAEHNKQLENQQKYVVELLSSALTKPVAEKFSKDGFYPSSMENLVIVYIDAVDFSVTASKILPERGVSEIIRFFKYFDNACETYHIETLRAVGDARVAVAGLSSNKKKLLPHQAVIGAILSMLEFRKMLPSTNDKGTSSNSDPDNRKALWPARIGIHIGPVVTGVIDTRNIIKDKEDPTKTITTGRLWFDVYGEAVNVACRLSQASESNEILVSEKILWEAGELFEYTPIKSITVKNTYIPECSEILGIRKKYLDENGKINNKFWDIYNDKDYAPIMPNLEGNRT